MLLDRSGEACPRCGLFHDPKDHGDHEHRFDPVRHVTCRAIVTMRKACECGEPWTGHLRFRLGEPTRDPLVVIGRALGWLGRGETYG